MGKITILLKQHTPMLHFQADEPGCTLRATEVKPKLDRFIVEQLGGRSFVPDDYWIDASKKGDTTYFALDYKLKFQAKGNNNRQRVKSYPTFFGNMGDSSKEKKELIYYPEGISMIIFSLNTKLQEIITQHINEFFAFHNFGTRQSKGFGSFYIDERDKLYYKPIESIPSNPRYVILSSFSTEDTNDRSLFNYIDTFYKSIRSGINICKTICFKNSYCKERYEMNDVNICNTRSNCDFKKNGSIYYCKSLLFRYINSKNKQWDKKTIKQLINGEITRQEIIENQLYLYRDLLGLATDVQYGKETIKKEYRLDNSVQRFKSPIFIKPIIRDNKYIVYVGYIQLEAYENILNKEFKIKISQKKTRDNRPKEDILFNISTPSDFSIKDYFDYLLKKDNLGKYKFEIEDVSRNKTIYFKKEQLKDAKPEVNPKYKNGNKEDVVYKNLKHIYKELRKNYK